MSEDELFAAHLASPHNPQPIPRRGTDLVYKPVVSEAPSEESTSCLASNEETITGGLDMTLRQGADVPPAGHPQTDSPQSTNFGAFPHTPVPHELRHALSTARTLCNQLEIANRPVELRVALWLREQILLALLELEGYVELDPGDDGRSALPSVLGIPNA